MITTSDTGGASQSALEQVELQTDLCRLLDRRYYERQAGETFHDDESALQHYADVGARRLLDPSPYFDTEFYFGQAPDLFARGVDPLDHFGRWAPHNRAYRPNPLFGNGYYLEISPDARAEGANPLVHYLDVGATLARPASAEHGHILRACGAGIRQSLSRGRARNLLIFFGRGGWQPDLISAIREIVAEHGAIPIFLFGVGSRVPPGLLGEAGVVDIGQVAAVNGVDRPSAMRLVARSLASLHPRAVFTEMQEAVLPAHECGVPVYAVLPAGDDRDSWSEVDWLTDLVERLIVPSSDWFHYLRERRGAYPTNVAVRPLSPAGTPEPASKVSAARSLARSIFELARRDGLMGEDMEARSISTRRVIVLCSDWGLSGVNSAIAAVGQDLRSRGWDLELLFTRDRAFVEQSAGSQSDLPNLPYRYLQSSGAGVEAMWQRLIVDLADSAPCIVLIAYDFFGNSVVPALANDVGVVMWAQADDGDYYEQAYRLGRYCNAIVCVSSRIREQIAVINPGLGKRAHIIHNTSITDAEIAPRLHERSATLRIIYTGRLVQYQKRVLDFVRLADELEALRLDFTIDLVGDAPPAHDEASSLLPQRAARHLESGRMRMLGRLSRAEVLVHLRASDLFVLLSDFEGLPLSLIEAMAAGCVPIVAEMESGISEVLVPEENGVIVHGRDYAQWARTICDLWKDEARLTAMAERAQQTVRRSFTVERIADQFDDILRRVAEEIGNGYERPPALTWGPRRSQFGDVIPPPSMLRAVPVAGLG